jgi:MFS family permease/HEAT repeat protein
MSELTNFEKLRKLKWQLAGNAFNTISCATNFYGGSMFILFLNELKLDTARIGLLLSMLPFFGITSLFTAPYIARIGFKRTFVGYAFGRLIFVALLLLAPLVLRTLGTNTAFLMVAIVTGCFALSKALGETALTPWQQELIPDMIRGKFGALTGIVQLSANAATIFIGGLVIGQVVGLTPYMILISGGLVIGLLSAWCYSFMPGGEPITSYHGSSAHFKQMYEAVNKDRNYGKYIIGMSLVFIGFCVATTFVALFMKNEVGLSSKIVIWLDIASFIGGIASSYLWGWAADRYGSKPVMLMGPLTMLIFPFICFLTPRNSIYSVIPAMLVPFIIGAAGMAWNLGLGRYLYVNAMPPEKKTAYTAVYYASLNLASAIGISISGTLLKLTTNFRGSFFGFTIAPYTPIFVIGMSIILVGIVIIAQLKRGTDTHTVDFIKMFVKGNPIAAFWALIQHKAAKNEQSRIYAIQQLGHSQSPLSNRELISSLNDPSFNVCLDAVIALSQRKPEPDLVKALEEIIQNERSQKSVLAAWALGKMKAQTAVPILRKALNVEYPLLQCAAARSLAILDDTESVESIAQLLIQEKNIETQVGYAFSLGRLNARKYSPELLNIMADCNNSVLKREAVLAVAMLTGKEENFIALRQSLQSDYATGIAQALWSLKKSAEKNGLKDISTRLETASLAFSQNNTTQGTQHLIDLLQTLCSLCNDSIDSQILSYCTSRINNNGNTEKEYISLMIHTITEMFSAKRLKNMDAAARSYKQN